MAKKNDDEKEEKAAEKEAKKEAKQEAPTIISGLPPEDYMTEQDKAAAAGKPTAPTDETPKKGE